MKLITLKTEYGDVLTKRDIPTPRLRVEIQKLMREQKVRTGVPEMFAKIKEIASKANIPDIDTLEPSKLINKLILGGHISTDDGTLDEFMQMKKDPETTAFNDKLTIEMFKLCHTLDLQKKDAPNEQAIKDLYDQPADSDFWQGQNIVEIEDALIFFCQTNRI